MYTNYAYGVQNQTGTSSANYNLFVTGTNDYTGSTGFMIKNDTTLSGPNKKGTRIFQDNTDNAYLDFRTTATDGAKSFAFRLQDDSSPSTFNNMLTLNKDTVSDTSVYGASVSGRVKASQFFVNQPDTRVPNTAGVYLGQNNATTGYFNINKGTGTGGFNFQTFNADGVTNKTNLSLNGSGSVQIPYYSTVTTDSQDSETTAMAVFDSTGNLVRSYQQNQRFRSVETRLNSLEGTVVASVPIKVNEIITRLNTLKIWNTKIDNLSVSAPPAPFNPSPATTAAVQVQLALSVSLTTAQDPTWQTSFINAVATNLGISPSRIMISSVSLTATVYSATYKHLTVQKAYTAAAAGSVFVNVVVNPDPTGVSSITPSVAASTIIAKAQDPSSDLAVAVKNTGAAVDTGYVPAQKPSTILTPAPQLYDFTTFTFTPNGATGRYGPTALTYSTATYPWISSYLTVATGIQRWIVPKTGTYNLIAAGARGGSTYEKYPGGWGIVVSTSVSLTKNDAIYILVGQRGGDAITYGSQQGGAGGGTFIVKYLGGATVSASYPITQAASYQILLIAGGGGGGCGLVNSQDGLATTTGGVVASAALSGGSTLWSTPATNGSGGGNGNLNPAASPAGSSAGGAGFIGNGIDHSVTWGTQPQGTSRQGYSFINGGAGGTGAAETGYDNQGGFGGGAGSGSNSNWGVGGAGGYSGGAGGGGNQAPWVWTNTGAGGGGSYDINGTNNNATFIKTNGNDGYAIIYNSSYIAPFSIVEPNNLQYYYRFDSSDVSGVNVANCASISTDNDRGTLVNSAAISTSDKAKGTASLSVSSASSQCMTLPPFKMHSSYTGFSVSLWAKKNGSAAGNSVIFCMSQINVGNTQDKAQPQFIYHIAIDGSNLSFYYYNNQSTVGTSFWTGVSPTVWNHIVWTVSSSGVSTFYVNNVDKTSSMNSNYWPAHSQSTLPTTTYNNGVYPYVKLGCDQKNAQYFNGNIDDFRMYTSPLTSSQVSNLYNST